MSLQRMQILLEDWQEERLKELAAERRTSISALVRKMVAQGLEAEPRRRRLMDVSGIGRRRGPGLKALDEEIYGGGS